MDGVLVLRRVALLHYGMFRPLALLPFSMNRLRWPQPRRLETLFFVPSLLVESGGTVRDAEIADMSLALFGKFSQQLRTNGLRLVIIKCHGFWNMNGEGWPIARIHLPGTAVCAAFFIDENMRILGQARSCTYVHRKHIPLFAADFALSHIYPHQSKALTTTDRTCQVNPPRNPLPLVQIVWLKSSARSARRYCAKHYVLADI